MILLYSPAPNFFICSKKIFSEGEEHVTRICERSVLILMLDGVLRFREGGRVITLEKGEYYIQRQMLLQEGMPLSQPPTYYYIEFFGSYSENGQGIPLRGKYDAGRILPTVKHLCEAVRDKRQNGFHLASYMNSVFGELAGGMAEHSGTAQLIKDHIESEYASPVSLSLLSRRFGYTEDYINRLFKKEYGTTPHRYLISIRMKHALWLIENTTIPAEKVAVAVGYSEFSSFWRAFKAEYGLSPGEIRKKR